MDLAKRSGKFQHIIYKKKHFKIFALRSIHIVQWVTFPVCINRLVRRSLYYVHLQRSVPLCFLFSLALLIELQCP